MAFGIDYSYGSGLTTGQMRSAGVTFVARYLSYLPNTKCINKAEFDNLVKAGLHVVLVWEDTGRDCARGHAGGVADATEANRQASIMGAHNAVIYFAPCDYDAPPGDQPSINAYIAGAASVIGHGRTGMYGGYYPLKRAFDAKVMTYGWQTYAWSGGNWDSRAHLQQYQNAARLGPAEVDYDRSTKSDYGQWPRPAPPAAAPAKPAAPARPAPPASHPVVAGGTGPFKHALGDRTLEQMAQQRGTTVEHLWVTTVRAITQGDVATIGKLKLGADFPVYTTSP